jgi:hypothetical protein
VLASRCSGLARAGQGLFCDLGRDGFEFGEELAEPAVGVEVAAELLGVFVVEGAGDGRAVFPPGPGWVGPVELGWVGFAVASGSLAAGHALGDGGIRAAGSTGRSARSGWRPAGAPGLAVAS